MKLSTRIIQQTVNGPWRWIIIDEQNRVVAQSPEEYQGTGWARKNLTEFLKYSSHLLSAGTGSEKVGVYRAVQLPLFGRLETT